MPELLPSEMSEAQADALIGPLFELGFSLGEARLFDGETVPDRNTVILTLYGAIRLGATQGQPKRMPIPPGLRFEVMRRDGFRCQLCGATAADGASLEVDHKYPVSKGGGNNRDNLWVLCRVCNSGKGDKVF